MTWRTTIASQKGGSGKTTVSLNLALALAERGERTLLVDLDPQGGVGHSLAKGDAELVGLADALVGATSVQEAILQTKLPSLALMPRGRLDPVDACDFEQALHRADVLNELLQAAESGFEHVLLDTPSGLGLPTRGAMGASDFVLVPLQAEPLALRTIEQILRVIDHVRREENDRLELLGLLPTMVARKDSTSMEVLIQSWRELAGVLETTIPRAPVFLRGSEAGLPIAYLEGTMAPEARRFEMLANEIRLRMNELKGRSTDDVERPRRQLL